MSFNFDTTYLNLNSKFFTEVKPEKIDDPKVLILNDELMGKLKLKPSPEMTQVLSGNKLLGPSISQAYAGHQFGHFTNLGDGRAVLLGEHVVGKKRFDIQLKGSGITPYSRGGDGKATVSSMLREYIYSIALTNLNVKSSESLAVILTNEEVMREKLHKGALLVRVMDSHIRIGTFEFVSYSSSADELKEFTDYVIKRHYKHLEGKDDKHILFFEEVMENQMKMVIDWLRVGFIHGVMNTDNMNIIGETFDYGPCAFMNSYSLRTKFSQIDEYGRYSFGNQEKILFWNLQRFAETLIPIIDSDKEVSISKLNNSLSSFDSRFKEKFNLMMKSKLGIKSDINCDDLINRFFKWLQKSKADYTNTFLELQKSGSFDYPEFKTKEFLKLKDDISKVGLNKDIMKKANPQFILRNYIVEEVIESYEKNENLEKFNELLQVMKDPYKYNSKYKKYQSPPKKDFDKKYYTHCNT